MLTLAEWGSVAEYLAIGVTLLLAGLSGLFAWLSKGQADKAEAAKLAAFQSAADSQAKMVAALNQLAEMKRKESEVEVRIVSVTVGKSYSNAKLTGKAFDLQVLNNSTRVVRIVRALAIEPDGTEHPRLGNYIKFPFDLEAGRTARVDIGLMPSALEKQFDKVRIETLTGESAEYDVRELK